MSGKTLTAPGKVHPSGKQIQEVNSQLMTSDILLNKYPQPPREDYNSQRGKICYSDQVWFSWLSCYLVDIVSQGCTEMALVSRVTEHELQMLFLCHLHLAVMSLPRRCSPVPARQTGVEASLSLAWLRVQPKAPNAYLLSHPSLFVCWVSPEGRSHNNPGKSIQDFRVDLVFLFLLF